jgi:phage gp37-like protein
MIGIIEQAIIDRIKAVSDSGVLGYKLSTIKSYGGEFSDQNTRGVVRLFPAALVMFDGAKVKRQTNTALEMEVRFGVFVAAKNLRSEESARRGDGVTPGTYQIMGDIIQLLSNSDLGLDVIDDLSFEDARLIMADRSEESLLSVYGLSFTTCFRVTTLPDTSGIDDFETFHSNWDVPVLGNVSTTLPADVTADATDHIEVPQ